MPLSCEVVEKRWFLGPRFVGEGIPQILDMRFQIALTSDHVAGYGGVPFSELGGYRGRKKEDEESLVKVRRQLCRAA